MSILSISLRILAPLRFKQHWPILRSAHPILLRIVHRDSPRSAPSARTFVVCCCVNVVARLDASISSTAAAKGAYARGGQERSGSETSTTAGTRGSRKERGRGEDQRERVGEGQQRGHIIIIIGNQCDFERCDVLTIVLVSPACISSIVCIYVPMRRILLNTNRARGTMIRVRYRTTLDR